MLSLSPTFFNSIKFRWTFWKINYSYGIIVLFQIFLYFLWKVLSCSISVTKMIFPKLFFICFKYSRKVFWLNISYCLKSCLPSIVSVPNTHVFWCEPVIVTMDLVSFGSLNFLLISTSCTNIDSSCSTAMVNPSGICLESISWTLF